MHIRNSIALLGGCIVLLALLRTGVRAVGFPVNNIDAFQPIIRRSPALGQSVDLFGFATVLHQIEEPSRGDTIEQAAGKTRIIVGAPRGTFPGGLSIDDPGEPAAPETGLVYSCPVSPGECEGIRGDISRYVNDPFALNNNATGNTSFRSALGIVNLPQSWLEGRLFDQAPNAVFYLVPTGRFNRTENKTGQLLGATLFSDGSNFIACAPRWTDTGFSDFFALPRGVCYISGRNLQNFQRLQPCSEAASSGNIRGDGYCMAGTSAFTYNGGYVLGAPLHNDGRGVLYYSTGIGPPATFIEGRSQLPNTDANHYQGFSSAPAFITSARVDGATPPNVVAAVPRYTDNTYTGRITVYSPLDNAQNLDVGAARALLNIDARGIQMGEFFGHSLIAIDLNGDRYDDLVIGAPMNTDYDALRLERGRIYIFFNNGMGNIMSENPVILNGSIPGGRFGTSLTNLGDIDLDGFEDFAVGAPYAKNGDNTGIVYIYYGHNNRTIFENQQPFEITASNVVRYVTSLSVLKTFGFSLSGGSVDVDNNGYNDLVVGAYEGQTVLLFRTLPVANVTVTIQAPAEVALDGSFQVTLSAYYEGRGVSGQIAVPFTLTEVRQGSSPPRLRFDTANQGTFTLRGSGSSMTDSHVVTVTSLENTTSLDPHLLQVTIEDLARTVTPVSGNQPLSDLSSLPRLKLQGETMREISVIDPCGGNGCQGDIRLDPPSETTINVVAGGPVVYATTVSYASIGSEDAVGVNLTFADLATSIRSVAIQKEGGALVETPCSTVSGGSATCILGARISIGTVERVRVNFTLDQENLIGNENDFTVRLEVVSQTNMTGDRDVDLTNNDQRILFTIGGQADISITDLTFGGNSFDYNAVAPSDPITTTGLGRSVTLEVDIRNKGPTTIREGSVTVYFANRIMDTGYTLYLTRISDIVSGQNGKINCSSADGVVNPDELPTGSPQVSESRRRRSAAASQGTLKRVTRQVSENTIVNRCIGPTIDSGICTTITCKISELRPGNFTVSIFTRVDERFFSSQSVAGTVYRLTSSASVSVVGDFYGDSLANNNETVTITLTPMSVEQPGNSGSNLVHFILWPCIGGILLLILAAVLLYFVGFFSRKKKPGEGEVEGDFDVDQYDLKPHNGREPLEPVGAAALVSEPEPAKVDVSEVTKV